jgi:hypothetical protein
VHFCGLVNYFDKSQHFFSEKKRENCTHVGTLFEFLVSVARVFFATNFEHDRMRSTHVPACLCQLKLICFLMPRISLVFFSSQVKKAFIRLIVAMADNGYLTLEGGHNLVTFLLRQCAISDANIAQYDVAQSKVKRVRKTVML